MDPRAHGRLGAYRLTRAPLAGPGVYLASADSPNDEPVWLVWLALRAETGRFENALIQSVTPTAQWVGHGALTHQDGARTLYWALSRDPAETLALWDRLQTNARFAELALALARRLATQHLIGAHEPLLAEQTLIIGPQPRPLELSLDFQKAAQNSAIACEDALLQKPLRSTPDEIALGQLTRRGDLWRLGRALTALAPRNLPPQARAILERLALLEPELAFSRAHELVLALENALGHLNPTTPIEVRNLEHLKLKS